MKFTVKKDRLAKTISIVSKAISTRTMLPFMSHILIEAKQDQVVLTASNLDVIIRHRIEQEIVEEGIIFVPAKVLSDLIGSLPNIDVVFETPADTWNSTSVRCGKFKANINGIDPADFPVFDRNEGKTIIVEPEDLSKAIQRVAHAAAIDDIRPVLAGIYMTCKENQLMITGADGLKIAEQKICLSDTQPKEFSVIVPATIMKEIGRLATDLDTPIEIITETGRMWFRLRDTEVGAALISGSYPEYQQYFPKEYQAKISVAALDFLNIVKAMRVFGDDQHSTVRVAISDNVLKLSAVNEYGNNESEIEVEVYGEIDGSVGYNGKFMADILGVLGNNQLVMSINGHKLPTQITIEGDDSFRYVIAPITS